MSVENVDLQSFAQQLTMHFAERLSGSGLPAEEIQDNTEIIAQFNNIAVGLLTGEPGIELPGTEQVIPWDETTSVQGLTLFAEGIYMGMMKCFQLRIPNEIKKRLLQEFALDVYTQAKQIVASTYGQEHTPEFQLSHEQQVALISQSSDSALMYYVNKYEQENGPIETVGPLPVGPLTLPAASSEMIQPAPIPVAAPAQHAAPKGPTPHDKYGAVALLLTTMPASHRAKVLQSFNAEEKELIAFYSEPQHIEQNLDVNCVADHLKRLKTLFRSGATRPKHQGHRGLARLAEQYPMEKLLSFVNDERPVVQQALVAAYHVGDNHPLASLTHKTGPKNHVSDVLPSRIEDILYQHLQRRLEAASQRA